MKKAIFKVLAGLSLVSFSIVSEAKVFRVTPEIPFSGIKLQDGDSYIEFIEGEVIHVDSQLVSVCPQPTEGGHEMVCLGLVNQTIITVRFHLGGCLDTLGSVAITKISNDISESSSLVVSALRIANKRSIVARCVAEPTQDVQFVLTNDNLSKEQVESMIRFSGK